ncbi:hypothetical protein BC833DRAFT_606091 [Globomyces pollinis-pini]|nr:hypothetical protein BC833DRAFT_606091 [Globomyces pollinis-pini]
MSGSWTLDDNLTWKVSAFLGFIWIFNISLESLIRSQVRLFWVAVYVSLMLIAAKNYLVISYNNLLDYNKEGAKMVYKLFEIVNLLVHFATRVGMYQRKSVICPTQYWDMAMLILVASVSTLACSVCLFGDAGTCWVWSNPIQGVSLVLTIGYFDIYYVLSVLNLYRQRKTTSQIVQVLFPAFWTIVHSSLYIFGALAFSFAFSNFYTNTLWNFSSVMIPIVTMQSNISANVSTFVESMQEQPSKPLSSNNSFMWEVSALSNRHITVPNNSPNNTRLEQTSQIVISENNNPDKDR